MIYVLDARDWNRVVAHIDEEDIEGSYAQGLDGENTLSLSIPSTHSARPHIKDFCRFVRRNRRGYWQEYVAWKITEKSGGRFMEVLANGAEQEIDTLKIMHAGKYEAETLAELAQRVVGGTGYELGMVDFASYQTETIENAVGGYAFLKRLGNYFERELRFRIEVSGTKVLGRYVDILERIGRDNPRIISFGDNLAELERIIHTDRIVTKLECRGPERDEGERLTAEIVDEDAFARWNLNGKHRVDYYEPSTTDSDMTQERLEQLGRMELKKRNDRAVEYILSVAVFPGDDYALGDTNRIEDTSFTPTLYAESRIIHESGPLSYVPEDVTEIQFKFGEIEEFSAEDLRSEFKRLQELYATKIIRQAKPPTPQKRTIWIQEVPTIQGFSIQSVEEEVFEIPHIANSDLTDWIPMTATAAEQIGGVELEKEYNQVSIGKATGLKVTGVEDEPVGAIDGTNGEYYFPKVETAELVAPNVLRYADYSEEEYVLRVASEARTGIGEPSDDNDGLSWSTPLRTIREALRRVAPSFKGTARILSAYGQTFYEDIEISGYMGGGTLVIERSAETTRPKVAGYVVMENNLNRIEWRDINLDSNDSYAGFFVRNTKGIIANVLLNGAAGETSSGINVNAGGNMEVVNVRHSNVVTAVRASYGGVASCEDNTGTVSGTVFIAYSGGTVSGGGTAPTGAALDATIKGGTINGTWTVPTPPAPPAPTTKTSKQTWSANSDSGTWRADEGRYDIYGASVNNVTQGAYSSHGPFTGAWFFGSAPSTAVTGKAIKSIRLYVGRVSGGSGSSVGVKFRPHISTSRPSGRVSLQAPEYTAGFAVGQDKWITLPASFHSGFENGTYKGIAIYSGSSGYAKMKKTAKLEITYEE